MGKKTEISSFCPNHGSPVSPLSAEMYEYIDNNIRSLLSGLILKVDEQLKETSTLVLVSSFFCNRRSHLSRT